MGIVSPFKVAEAAGLDVRLVLEDRLDDDGGGRAGLAEPLLPASDQRLLQYTICFCSETSSHL